MKNLPSLNEVRQEYHARGPFDFLVPGGGHGAAAVCRALLTKGYRVASAANTIDEGGHSARLRWDLYRRLGYWPIIPGDTMNLLGGGFEHPAIYSLVNTGLPQNAEKAPDSFAKICEEATAKGDETDRLVLEEFRTFFIGMGDVIQRELIETGITSLPGANIQNLLHASMMLQVGAYRMGLQSIDLDRYLIGSYLLERELRAKPRGLVVPMTFDKVSLVTKHAGGRTVVGGINRVLRVKGDNLTGLEYGEMIPNSMVGFGSKITEATQTPLGKPEEESRKLSRAKVIDWHAAEVDPGPAEQPFDDSKALTEIRPRAPRINPFLLTLLREMRPEGTIIIPPGNAHESTYTFFLLAGLWEELQKAKRQGVKVTLICNPVNLLLTTGYTIEDYLRSIEQAAKQATRGGEIKAEEIVDRIVVNNASSASSEARRLMSSEDLPEDLRKALLHRIPTGPFTISAEEKKTLECRGFKVVVRDLLEMQRPVIRGARAATMGYESEKLLDAIL